MEKLEITGEELESLKAYLGFKHAAINCVGSDDVYDLIRIQKKGYFTARNKDDIEKCIKDFINVYSLIYKNFLLNPPEYGLHVKRGTSSIYDHLVREDYPTNKFSSSTTNFDIANEFANIETGDIVELNSDENVPYLDVMQFMKKYPDVFETEIKNNRDEQEIIVPPYVKSTKVKRAISSTFKDYEATIEKCELKVEDFDNEKAKKDLTDDYEEYLGYINELEYLRNIPNSDEKRKRWLSVRIDAYTKRMSEVVQNMCASKEKEIDKAYEKTMAKEYKERIKQNYTELEKNIIEGLREMVNKSNYYADLSREIRIQNRDDITKYDIPNKVMQIRENMKNQLATKGKNTVEQVSKRALEESGDLRGLAKEYNKKLDEDFKEELYMKIQGSLKVAKIWQYSKQLEDINDNSSGIMDRITGKDALKKEQRRSLNIKIQREKEAVKKKESYSMRDMITDIYYTSKHELGGKLTPEMQEESNFIIKHFGVTVRDENGKIQVRKFTPELIDQLVANREREENEKSNLPVVQQNRFFGNRKMAKALREENDKNENEIKNKKSAILLEDFRDRNVMNKIYANLTRIEEITRKENSKEEKQKDKKEKVEEK